DLLLGRAPRLLEVTCGGEMARLALPLRQRLVRDTPKQVLEEGVLTALGRPRVGLHREDLLAHQTDHERVELVLAEAGQRAQTTFREGLAENGGVLDDPRLLRRQAVEARRAQAVERH